jgi:hypothetical protein
VFCGEIIPVCIEVSSCSRPGENGVVIGRFRAVCSCIIAVDAMSGTTALVLFARLWRQGCGVLRASYGHDTHAIAPLVTPSQTGWLTVSCKVTWTLITPTLVVEADSFQNAGLKRHYHAVDGLKRLRCIQSPWRLQILQSLFILRILRSP